MPCLVFVKFGPCQLSCLGSLVLSLESRVSWVQIPPEASSFFYCPVHVKCSVNSYVVHIPNFYHLRPTAWAQKQAEYDNAALVAQLVEYSLAIQPWQ